MCNPQTGKWSYQRNSPIVAKVLGLTSDFSVWRSGKGTGNLQGIWLWRTMGFDHRTSTGLRETDCWRAQTKSCVHHDPGERSSDLSDWARTACESFKVSCRGLGQQWPTTGTKALAAAVLGGMCWNKSFWRSILTLLYSLGTPGVGGLRPHN